MAYTDPPTLVQDRIIMHRYREERRAVHHLATRTLTYEKFDSTENVWKPDYTTNDSEMRTDYFTEFYG